jgi:CHAD domain-containing protein
MNRRSMAHATTQTITALASSLRRNASTLTSASQRAKRGEVRGIHRLRVATRRLREALPASAELVAADSDDIARDLRKVTKGLGPVRELDVARTVLADFAEREAWPEAVVARVDEYCERLRDRALAGAAEAIDGFDAKDVRKNLEAVLAKLEKINKAEKPEHPTGKSSLGTRRREAARILARRIEEAGTLYSPTALHEIRIAAKKLRYVVELTGEPAPGSLRRLRALQSGLGRMHDAQVLQHRIQELAATSGDRGLVATLTSMERTLETTCREWHAKLLKNLPGIRALADGIVSDVPTAVRPGTLGRPARMTGTKAASEHARRRVRIA